MGLDIRGAACAYLRGGKVTILTAVSDLTGPRRPYAVTAQVNGHSSTYSPVAAMALDEQPDLDAWITAAGVRSS